MHTLLSVQLAFESKQAGKNVVCRHIDDTEFQSLKDVSANCWFDPDYVFALQIDTITLGGFEFTKPYTLDELEAGMHIYYIGGSGTILKGHFNPDNEMLVSGVNNGSVQRDLANAVLQIEGFRSLLGVTADEPTVVDYDFFVVDAAEPKKRGGGRKKKESKPEVVETELNQGKDDSLDTSDPAVKKYIDAIASASSNAELVQIEDNIIDDTHKYAHEELTLFRKLITQKRQTLIGQPAFAVPTQDEPQALEDTAELIENVIDTFKLEIEQAKSISDLQGIRMMLDKNSHLKDEDKSQLKHILGCKENSLSQLSIDELHDLQKDAMNIGKSNCHQNIASLVQNLIDDMDAATTLDELQKVRDIMTHNMDSFDDNQVGDLQIHFEKRKEEINQIDWVKDGEDKVNADDCANTIRNATTLDKLKLVECSIRADLREEKVGKVFADFLLKLIVEKRHELIAIQCDALIQQVKVAKTADEANQPAAETTEWTDEQRIPLLAAISKRLVELDVSLLTQIRNAPSMAILNALVSEVKNLAPGTYPHQCMEAYMTRKNQLTTPAS